MSHSNGRSKKVRKDREVVENSQDVKNELIISSVNLLNMPYETITAILMECKTLDFISLISTCRTLKDLSTQEERRLYRHHYHEEIPAYSHLIHSHIVYSPVKSSKIIIYSLTDLLPSSAVNSWKVQLTMWMIWRRNGLDRKCMLCYSGHHPNEFITCATLKLRLCKICYAKNLVSIDDLANFQLTKSDVKGVIKVESRVERTFRSRTNFFYSCIHLLSIAQQKHGENFVPRTLQVEKLISQQERQIMIEVATIIHGGCWYEFECSGKAGIRYPNNGGRFNEEFQQYLDGVSYKNSSGLKTRPLASILTDYIHFVKSNQFHPSFRGSSRDSVPSFLPSKCASTILPSVVNVEAYRRVCRQLSSGETLMRSNSIKTRLALQNYIISPTSDNWILLAEQNRSITREKLETAISELQKVPGIYRVDFSEIRKSQNQNLSQVELARLKVSSQIHTIIGEHSYIWDHHLRSLERHYAHSWVGDYFTTGDLKSTLKQVYEDADHDRKSTLRDIAQNALGVFEHSKNWTTVMATESLATLTQSYYDTNQQRCHNRLLLHPITRSKVVDEIQQAVKSFESGSITATSIRATTLARWTTCTFNGQRGIRCISDCWYTRIGTEVSYCHGCGGYH